MVELALSPEEQQRRAAMQQFQAPTINAPQMMQPQKGPLGMATDMATEAALGAASDKIATPLMNAAVDKGKEVALQKATEYGLTGAGTSGMMAGIGTAMPYIGAGLLAGKAFGLFSQGGPVYKQSGGYLQGPLALRKIKYKQHGGKIELEATMGE